MLKTIREVAEFLHISPKMVRGLIKAGHIRLVKIGRLWRIDDADVDLFIARHKV
jgi:excisionase family DNA binding protein